jgi:hypothetical protein
MTHAGTFFHRPGRHPLVSTKYSQINPKRCEHIETRDFQKYCFFNIFHPPDRPTSHRGNNQEFLPPTPSKKPERAQFGGMGTGEGDWQETKGLARGCPQPCFGKVGHWHLTRPDPKPGDLKGWTIAFNGKGLTNTSSFLMNWSEHFEGVLQEGKEKKI